MGSPILRATVGAVTTSSYLEIDNNFTDPGYKQTRGLDALRVTIAHEFHHAIQFGYYAKFDGSWWQESTSTWMEEVAYPHIDDYLQYLTYFLGEPQRALNSGVYRRTPHSTAPRSFLSSSISATAASSTA